MTTLRNMMMAAVNMLFLVVQTRRRATTTWMRRKTTVRTYAETGYDCDGSCLNDEDGDGVCDESEIAGCTDAAACNYNADATG